MIVLSKCIERLDCANVQLYIHEEQVPTSVSLACKAGDVAGDICM